MTNTGRRVQLLGQTIEEIHKVGHMRFSFDADEMKENYKLTYPNAQLWLEHYKLFQQSNCHIAP